MITHSKLDAWWILNKQLTQGWHMSTSDKQLLQQLNHEVMEDAHKIHNDNMLEVRKSI